MVQCFRKHGESLAKQLGLQQGLIQYAIQRWHAAPTSSKARGETEEYLVQLIAPLPSQEQSPSSSAIHQAIPVNSDLGREARYELLRLLLRSLKGYEMDIEDGSESGIARLKELPLKNDLWPATLFFDINTDKAFQLFSKLDKAHPSGEFLSPSSCWYSRTVLK